MKKLFSLLITILLSCCAFALQYTPIVYDFNGLNSSGNSLTIPSNQMSKMLNFTYDYAGKGLSSYKGFSKAQTSAGNKITFNLTGRGRGLYQFYPLQGTNLSSYIISSRSINDYATGEVRYDTATMETTAGTSFNTPPYHMNFESWFDPFRATDTLYMANGYHYKKWFRDTGTQETIVASVSDIGATPLTLSSKEVIWTNGQTKVTFLNATADATTVKKGAWIRVNSGGTWYEVNYVTTDGHNSTAEIRTVFNQATTTDGSGQLAPLTSLNPRFILIWENRLWLANFNRLTSVPLVGTAVVGTAQLGTSSVYKQGTLLCSAIQSSVTPAALEDYSGTDTGYIYVGQNDNITWLSNISDTLFVFKEKEYIVYRYNAAYLPPIVETNRFNYGNLGQVVNTGNSLIYFTGKEVRQTNGFSDVKISDDIDFDLQEQHYYNNTFVDFYSLTATDNYYPTAVFNKAKNQYTLYITPRDTNFAQTTLRYGYTYDLNTRKWIGTKGNLNVGNIINYYPQNSSDLQLAYMPYSQDTAVKYFDTRDIFDNSTTGTLESADLSFGDPGSLKNIYWVEFWVYRQPVIATTEGVTLAFNYYADGALKLNPELSKTIYPLTSIPSNTSSQIQKIRFPVNVQCSFFKWRLRDTAWIGSSTNGMSVIGGQICYEVVKNS